MSHSNLPALVTLVRCDSDEPQALAEVVRRAVALQGGMERLVRPGDRVLVKPNLLGAYEPEKRVTTDPEVVRAVCELVLEAGGRPFIGDSPALVSFKRAAEKSGIAQVARDLGIHAAALDEPRPAPMPQSALFKHVEVASQALDADAIINLPKLKTHCQMVLTLGVKNLFGTIVAQRKAEWHHMTGLNRDTFAALHLDILQALRPSLTLLDGVWAMEGHGPSNGRPRRLGLVAAATDTVALDVAVCRLLGVPLRHFPLYRVARSRGMGDPNKVRYNGDQPAAFRVGRFEIPKLDSVGLLPSSLATLTERFLVSRPVLRGEDCAGCGECAAICPAGAVETTSGKVAFDYERCIRCYCCQEVCPRDAIGFKQGLLVRFLNRFQR